MKKSIFSLIVVAFGFASCRNLQDKAMGKHNCTVPFEFLVLDKRPSNNPFGGINRLAYDDLFNCEIDLFKADNTLKGTLKMDIPSASRYGYDASRIESVVFPISNIHSENDTLYFNLSHDGGVFGGTQNFPGQIYSGKDGLYLGLPEKIVYADDSKHNKLAIDHHSNGLYYLPLGKTIDKKEFYKLQIEDLKSQLETAKPYVKDNIQGVLPILESKLK